MSRWGLFGRALVSAVAFIGNWPAFAVAAVVSYASQRDAARKAEKARRAWNDAQKDRLQMVDVMPDAPRSLVLGRCRTVEGVRRRWSSGTNDEVLTLIVSFASHEIDAFEQFYIDDDPVSLDGSGWVTTAPYGKTITEPVTQSTTTDGSGQGSIVLSYTPVGTVTGYWRLGGGGDYESGALTVNVVDGVAYLSGAPGVQAAWIQYERQYLDSWVRIRPYLGTAAQNVGDAIDAEYPGKITSTDKFAGIALAVVDLIFSPDIFPTGVPNITAVLRGAKCYDPRTTTTVWTQNPALHARHYALWTGGLGLSSSHVRDADVTAAANRCDISTDFDMVMPDTSTDTVTLPRHRCGIVIGSDADRRQAMDQIIATMAGEWGWAGGILRMRAGMMGSSVAAIDQTWLMLDDPEQTEPVVTAVQAVPRE
ncbi:MAG: hypothetical protein RLZZ524_810, partial [Pseudomonadota bacterium]